MENSRKTDHLNKNKKEKGGSGRRLAAALILLLLIGGFFFWVSDSPGIVKLRESLTGAHSTESQDGGADTADNEGARSTEDGRGSTGDVAAVDPDKLPEFTGDHYVKVNGGVPALPDDVYEKAGYTEGGSRGSVSESGKVWAVSKGNITPYEYYGELDHLGRCTVAYGCLGPETMPAEDTERGDISRIHPSGWAKAQHWERCHLIAWALSDENANERNLITGTHYLNYDGMRPLEEETEHYIWNTGNHVLYMARPVFSGNELIARGVQMTCESVEDGGKGISFNVYLFNVTPDAEIDYRSGIVTTAEQAAQEPRAYVINTRSGVFHYPSCDGAKSIYKKNRKDVTATRKELTDQGYIPCGYCEP